MLGRDVRYWGFVSAASLTVLSLILRLLRRSYSPYSYPFLKQAPDQMDQGASYLLQVLAANATSAGTNGTSPGGAATAIKKKPKKHYYFMARNSWETIAGVILALAILNLFTRGLAYLRRRRNANKSAADFLSKREGSTAGGDVSVSNIPYAGRSILQNLGMCTVVPWWLGGATLGEVFWNVGYCAALGVFSFHQSKPSISFDKPWPQADRNIVP
jgi:hypothetical protein